MSQYRIIRTAGTLIDLEKAVLALGDVQYNGAPFRDEDAREWCQSVTVREPTDPNAKGVAKRLRGL